MNFKEIASKSNNKFLEGFTAYNMHGQEVVVSDLFGPKPVILKVLAKLSCAFCRYEARMLSDMKSEFDRLGVSLIAITYEKTGIKEFLNSGYWAWDILVDEKKAIYKEVGLKKFKLIETPKTMLSKPFRKGIAAIIKKKVKFSFKGPINQLGGTFVVGPYGRNLLYEFRQVTFVMFPSIKRVVSCVGGDPDLIEEEPIDCIGDKYFKKMQIVE